MHSSKNKIQKWFYDQNGWYLFLIISLIGLMNSFFFFPLLNGYSYNFGQNLMGLFLPVFLTVFYFTVTGYRHGRNKMLLVQSVTLYLIQILPFLPLFLQVFQPRFGDDFNRYLRYAQYMIRHHTVYGADELAYPHQGRHYITQPGYRYFIAGELILFRNLYRLVQFFNLGLYILAIYFFEEVVNRIIINKKIHRSVLLLILLSTPYATKNLLMGLSEWLCAALLMLVCYFYLIRKNVGLAIFILGLLPFFRQNLFIAVLLLAGWLLLFNKERIKLFFCFLVPFLLPLYHNIYYAGEWRFFVVMQPTPFISKSAPMAFDWSVALHNLFRLLGFEFVGGRVQFYPIALFLPFSLVVYFFLVQSYRKIGLRLFFLFTSLSAAVPALILGRNYYPRFEFLSMIVFLASFYLIGREQKAKKTVFSSD